MERLLYDCRPSALRDSIVTAPNVDRTLCLQSHHSIEVAVDGSFLKPHTHKRKKLRHGATPTLTFRDLVGLWPLKATVELKELMSLKSPQSFPSFVRSGT